MKEYPNVEVLDQSEFVGQAKTQVNQIVTIINILLGLSVLIALLGVINTLALSVIERTRELGLLRAVGMARKQVKRMIRTESVLICTFGGLLGLVVGSVFGIALQQALKGEGVTELGFPVVHPRRLPAVLGTRRRRSRPPSRPGARRGSTCSRRSRRSRRMRDGRTSAAGRVALGAVVLALLVVPGRLLAAEHAMDHELVPYAGTGARACDHRRDPGDRRPGRRGRRRTAPAGRGPAPRRGGLGGGRHHRTSVCMTGAGCTDVDGQAGPRVRLAGAVRLPDCWSRVTRITPGRCASTGSTSRTSTAGRRGTQHAGSALLVTVA